MNVLRKLLILVIILLFSFIFYRLLNQRQKILSDIEHSKKTFEGLISLSEDDPLYKPIMSEISSKSLDNTVGPANANDYLLEYSDLSLNQFCIKGSANSAFSGKYISGKMVQYVLSRGCRFLDFQVFDLPSSDDPNTENKPYVGFSKDPNSFSSLDSANTMKFSDILNTVVSSAFITNNSGYIVTNPKDPLFIHIRMNTEPSNMDNLYKKIQSDIAIASKDYDSNTDPHFMTIPNKKITGNTVISAINSKVVFVFYNYNPIDNENESNKYYHNMTSGTDILINEYSHIDINKYKANNRPKQITETTTNKTIFDMCIPDMAITSSSSIPANPNIYSSIKNYGIQVNLMQYYVVDMELMNNEIIFQLYKAGIMPVPNCLSYINNYATSDNNFKSVIFPKLFSR
jgi:hypothetical protein